MKDVHILLIEKMFRDEPLYSAWLYSGFWMIFKHFRFFQLTLHNKKSFIPSWHVRQLLQYTSTSMKVSPCLSGWADSLMAPLFALVRRVRPTTLTPTPQHSPYNLPFRVRKQPQRVLREEKVLYLIISSLHNEQRRARVFYEAANCSVEFPSAKVWRVRAPE